MTSEDTSLPQGNLIDTYGVIYLGGHPDYLNKKAGKIEFNVFDNRFELLPTIGTKSWFNGLEIRYENVLDFQITQRQVSTFEGIFGGLDSRQLNQANNIHITYASLSDDEIVLRLEMLSGFTVMGQASKCRQLEDRLNTNGIKKRFRAKETQVAPTSSGNDDITTIIMKLASLRDQGILSQDEFEMKKTDLLSRL